MLRPEHRQQRRTITTHNWKISLRYREKQGRGVSRDDGLASSC